jgi:hypothetical protein
MKKTRTADFLALTVATILATLFAFAQPASAAVRDWVPAVSYGPNWHCTQNVQPHYVIDTCLINSHNGHEPVYRAVMVGAINLPFETQERITVVSPPVAVVC